MKKHFLTALAVILLPALAMAQFVVNGKISNSTGESLPGASVYLGNRVTQSGSDGTYQFNDVTAGEHLIRVSFLGYQTQSRTIRVTGNQTYNITLAPVSQLVDEVLVSATRATSNTGATYRNISKAEIEKNNLGQDLPYLLNQTPSVVVSSDAGAGIGYTGIRIRGSDPTRTNVTINGIPLNDAESQGSFFIDLPDFASSVDNIQVQRGVGTSTNGAGAFGASLNIQTNTRRDSAYAELNNTFGSYNTWKNTVNVGTGLINGKFTFDGRLSRIKSNGYVDRGSSDLKSFFLSGAYYGKKDLLRVNVLSGKETTFQVWNGVPEAKLTGNMDSLYRHYYDNVGYLYNTTADSLNLFNADNRKYSQFLYPDQTDNYTQDHYQLLYSHHFSNQLTFNGALHYTYGRGYYEEYKYSQKLANYGLDNVLIGSETISKTDLVRRRWLDNDFYGLTYSLDYKPSLKFNLTWGGAYNEYDGRHFGEVIWAQYASDGDIHQHYYDGKGVKKDFNTYLKATYQLGKTSLYGDLQYRNIDYTISGTDKNRSPLDQHDRLNFFNPKVGIMHQLTDNSNIYISYAVANKEPNRDDYVNSTPATRPKSENLQDVEAGYRIATSGFNIGLNAYGMFYKDQLILTGAVNDVGESIRQNVPISSRMGLELDARTKLVPSLTWGLTATLSRNKIKQFDEVIYEYDANYDLVNTIVNSYDKPDIAFSPNFIASSELSWQPVKNAEIALLSKYVGRQYLDNTSNGKRQLDPFFVNDLRLHYQTAFTGIKNIGLTLMVNNLFSERYESNGYTYSSVVDHRMITENFYFPQATRNFLLALNVKF
ncbi:TonB-dependent receptor [Pedobacter sp. BS3]|uniref:TonB-dependent receptor n=1 Tax=Pedobacter sp. BS3 TaxID=2567937 RepID=UPI002938D158|nr:TonB-dependent receptor [Pedobacter sp. BS3]